MPVSLNYMSQVLVAFIAVLVGLDEVLDFETRRKLKYDLLGTQMNKLFYFLVLISGVMVGMPLLPGGFGGDFGGY